MLPGNQFKDNNESSSTGNYVSVRGSERDSLFSLLLHGQLLQNRRRVNPDNNVETIERRNPRDSCLRYWRTLHRGRRRATSDLDSTMHTTSYLLDAAVSVNNNSSVDTTKPGETITDEKMMSDVCEVVNGNLTIAFADTFTHQEYNKIDLSNMTGVTKKSNIQSLLCFNIMTNGDKLESLCLHNCEINDDCMESLSALITSKFNKLQVLQLSRNHITNVGVHILLEAMKSEYCHIQELDVSQNRLTSSAVALFAQNLSHYKHLKVLRLADTEHLLPLSTYQQFSTAIEKNCVMTSLTLGCEVMDGTIVEGDGSPFVDMDALLRYWWQEPMYTSIINHIRTLLQLNHAGLGELIQMSANPNDSSCNSDLSSILTLLDHVKPEKRLDAWYRILQLKPDLLFTLS